MLARNTIARIWNNIQYNLFPYLEQELGKLSSQHKKLVAILELIRIEEFIPSSKFTNGRPPKDLIAIARANIAKIVFKISYTKDLIRLLKSDRHLKQICGFELYKDVPSESKFSRNFKKFAIMALPEKVHQALIKEVYCNELLLNVVFDSTPIETREKRIKKELSRSERKKKRDRESKQAKRNGELNRREKQLIQDTEESLKNLPTQCDIGMKRSAHGYTLIWKGYKLHTAINDDCIPVAAIMTSASLNDCEAAIPLIRKSHQTILNLYDLMDAAYDHKEIRQEVRSSGRIPLIATCPHNPTQKDEKIAEIERKRILNFETVEDKQYKKRFPTERFNALFKDFHGGRNIFFKSYEKVKCHVMFGLLTMTASLIFNKIN